MMRIDIIQVKSRNDLKLFIHLPFELHKAHQRWAPPLLVDEWAYFDHKKNKNFGHSHTVMYLAYKDKKLVGRIMGIINNRHNEVAKEKTARWGYLESVEDFEVAKALVGKVEAWAKSHKMNKIVGPMGFTDQDPEGFVIEGFEGEPTISTYFNFPFIPEFVQKLGYVKEVDYFVYKIEVTKEPPKIYGRLVERVMKSGEFKLVEPSKKDLKFLIVPILSLTNKSFSHLYGYVPLTQEEMIDLGNKYIPVLNPKFVKVITWKEEVVAYILAIPNMDEGFRKAQGKLLPFGLLHILNSQKKSKQLDLLLGAIDERFRGRGLDAVMGTAMMKTAHAEGFEVIDSHLELESNVQVRSEMERAGGKIIRRYRIFKKKL